MRGRWGPTLCAVNSRADLTEPKSRAESFPLEQIVGAHSDVEHVPRCNARRIMIVIVCIWCGNDQPCGAEVPWRTLRVCEGSIDGRAMEQSLRIA